MSDLLEPLSTSEYIIDEVLRYGLFLGEIKQSAVGGGLDRKFFSARKNDKCFLESSAGIFATGSVRFSGLVFCGELEFRTASRFPLSWE